jgi:hypothetical protein
MSAIAVFRPILAVVVFSAILCASSSGSVRARRIVHIGDDYFLLKLTYRGQVTQSLSPERYALEDTRSKLASIGEGALGLAEINQRTDEAIFQNLILEKGWHLHWLKEHGHIPSDVNQETWDSIVFTFLQSTFYLTVEKLAPGKRAFENLAGTDAYHRVQNHIAELFRFDTLGEGELVGIYGIETLSPEHPTFYLEDRFQFKLPRFKPEKLPAGVRFRSCWVPGFEVAEPWYGDVVFMHSLLVRHDRVKQSLLREILLLLKSHGLLNTAQLVPAGETRIVGTREISGPAYTVPALIYSLAHGEARISMHQRLGFREAKQVVYSRTLPADEKLLEVALPDFNINPPLPLQPARQEVSLLPIFVDEVVRGTGLFIAPHPNVRYPQPQRCADEVLALE